MEDFKAKKLNMTGYVLLAFIAWIAIGYLVFYFRYENKNVVNELRSNLKDANKEIHHLNNELEEYTAQNTILREKTAELLDKNDDLSGVVSELSKYYFHIKKAAAKTSELTKFLNDPDPLIEEKMEGLIESAKNTHASNQENKDFF